MNFIGELGNYGCEVAKQLNPLNWSQHSQKKALKVVCVATIAFLGLTALERAPVGLAREASKFIYDCAMTKELNAVKAYGLVLAKTWDAIKAQEASSFILDIGKKVDQLPSNYYFVQACQTIANNLPYSY